MDRPLANPRVILTDVEVGETVRITLDIRGREYVGQAEITDDGIEVAAARATLQALDALTPTAATFELNWLHETEPDDLGTVLEVVVTLTVAGASIRHVGAALVRGDLPTTAARAVLDALNRRLEIMQLV